MGTKFKTLNREVEYLKRELYKLLDNEPWSKNDILVISRRLDDLILKFYN